MVFGHSLPERILKKVGVRSDLLWTSRALYLKPFRFLPFFADVAALHRSQYWTRAQIESYTKDRLLALMQDANRLPFWREHFKACGVDPDGADPIHFGRISVISKLQFQKEGVTGYINEALKPFSSPDHTSGSTGRPFDFFVDRSYELRAFAICERMLRAATGGERPIVISLRPREKLGFIFFKHHLFFLQNYNNIRHRLPALKELLDTIARPVILYGFPSAFIELAERVKEAGYRFNIKAAISTGESIRPSERSHIETNLHTNFFINYATRELGWLAFECEQHGLHLNEEWAFVEILDDNGEALPDGHEGHVVVTPFDNRVMPLIRYNNGDRGIISATPCPCGRTLRTIQVAGRQVEFITFEDGRTVSSLDLSTTFDWFSGSVKQFRVVQTAPLSFTVTVVPGHNFKKMQEKLTMRLVRLLHPAAVITWDVVEEIPAAKSGKAVTFVPYRAATQDHAPNTAR